MRNYLTVIISIFSYLFLYSNCAFGQCTVDTTNTFTGISQNGNYCFTKDSNTFQVWQFKNYDSLIVYGQTVVVDSISIDSILNLPSGLHWSTNHYPGNLYTNSESGCILVYGTSTDNTNLYRLNVAITAYIGGLPVQSMHISKLDSSQNLFAMVILPGAQCVLDTTATGINETDAPVNSLTNYPNPFSNNTDIVFVTLKNEPMTFTVYDLLGKAVRQQNIQTVSGRNIINFNRKGLQSGVYFYTITDGSQTFTNKMVITE